MHDTDQPRTHEPGPGTVPLPDRPRRAGGQPPTLLPKVSLELEVIDPDTGEVRTRRQAAANLATENWQKLMTALLGFISTSTYNTTDLTDVDGTTRTMRVYEADGQGRTFTQTTNDLGAELVIGDGGGSSVSPSRGDTALDNRLDKNEADNHEGSGKSIVSASFHNTSGGAWTVREVGILHKLHSGGDDWQRFLMWHDAVQDTNVPDGDLVNVTYTLEWP
jgi:hypothetical protein